MAWDLSADREREQMESLRNAWLEREEVILNHFRVSAAMFRWGYRILGIIAALVAAIMLAVGRRGLRCVVEKAEVFRRSIRRTHRSCASLCWARSVENWRLSQAFCSFARSHSPEWGFWASLLFW